MYQLYNTKKVAQNSNNKELAIFTSSSVQVWIVPLLHTRLCAELRNDWSQYLISRNLQFNSQNKPHRTVVKTTDRSLCHWTSAGDNACSVQKIAEDSWQDTAESWNKDRVSLMQKIWKADQATVDEMPNIIVFWEFKRIGQ
jgi:hypothetical protein